VPAPASRPTAKTSVPIITRVGRLAMVRIAGTGHLAGIARVPAPAAQISPRNGRGRSPSRQPGSPTKALHLYASRVPIYPAVARWPASTILKRATEHLRARLPFSPPDMSTPMRRTRSPFCAPAASGHAVAPASPAMNSRLRILNLALVRGLSRQWFQGNGGALCLLHRMSPFLAQARPPGRLRLGPLRGVKLPLQPDCGKTESVKGFG
jgi:hypothetical protein